MGTGVRSPTSLDPVTRVAWEPRSVTKLVEENEEEVLDLCLCSNLYPGPDHRHSGNTTHIGDETMYAIPIVLLVLGLLGGIALGYVIGKLKGEVITLRELMERRRRTQSDIAMFEDALAIVTDLAIRQDVEIKRNEAVHHYMNVRLASLSNILGQGRNGFDYESKPAKRPKDY